MSEAAVRKSQADILNQQKKDKKNLFAQRRQIASGTGSINFGNLATNSGGGSGGGLSLVNIESPSNTNALIKTGDTMDGPLAFKPNNITISGDKLTMSTILLSTPTSWCIATGEGNAADDLNYIITQYNGADQGALFSGQILILQAGVYNITLKHNTGNIYIPSGSDLTLTGYTSGTSTGGEIATLIYDDQVVGGKWILVATSKPLGSSSWVGTATSVLDMNNFNIEDVNALKINSDGVGSADSFTMFGTTSAGAINLVDDNDYFAIQVDGTSKLRIYDDKVEFRENLTTDTANTCDIGTGSAWFGHGYMDNLTLMGSNNPALWVATGTSYFGGYIEIDGRTSATGSIGKLGAKTTSDVIGLSTKCWYYGGSSTPYKLGTEGTLTSPYDESTTFPSSQSTLDDLFGDATGSIGVYEDTNGTTNYKVKFYYKGDDGWYQVSGSKV